MEKNTQISEIIVSTSDKVQSKAITLLKQSGKIVKIASRVYTSNLSDSPEKIVRRNLFLILGKLFPGAVISHRSALEMVPTPDGHLYLTYNYTRNIVLPGVTVHLLEGQGHVENDIPLFGLYISSPARAFLENLQVGYKKNGSSKCLDQKALEERLEKKLLVHGEQELNVIRDEARTLAGILGMEDSFACLDRIIGAMLTTKSSDVLKSPVAMAQVMGEPYDSERLGLFGIFFERLSSKEFEKYPEKNLSDVSFRNFAFFESYFSNYIEGTEFEVSEARRIVESGMPLMARNEDSHDILGYYRLCSDRNEMSLLPDSADDFISMVKRRHAVLMSARQSANPGMFKEQNNRAGDSFFVDYRLVKGTLKKGYEMYKALASPVARAYFMLFMMSEVHPFNDGNGRLSRLMMNAELTAAKCAKIIIPTVFRTDYLDALRRLTRNDDPSVLIRALERVRLFSSKLDGTDYDSLMLALEQSNAFKDEEEYILRF